jgi:hypothetical protein
MYVPDAFTQPTRYSGARSGIQVFQMTLERYCTSVSCRQQMRYSEKILLWTTCSCTPSIMYSLFRSCKTSLQNVAGYRTSWQMYFVSQRQVKMPPVSAVSSHISIVWDSLFRTQWKIVEPVLIVLKNCVFVFWRWIVYLIIALLHVQYCSATPTWIDLY